MNSETDRRAPFVIEWRDSFSIDLPQIDDEHRHLFELVKRLELATVDQTIEDLLDYVVSHFSNEQALMEQSGYPAFEQHLRLHEQFGAQVAEFLGSGEDWSEARVHEIRRFLNKWLIGHIMTHDLRFGRWYADQRQHQSVAVVPPAPAPGLWARLFGRG